MKTRTVSSIIFSILIISNLFAQTNNNYRDIAGSAFLENSSYKLLERICDEAGGRFLGTPQNERAIEILKSELEKIGCTVKLEKFKVPGWVRGNDEVIMQIPAPLKLQAVALGYVNATPTFTAGVVYASYGFDEDYQNINAEDKIVLVTQEPPKGKEQILRYEAIDIAVKHKAKAILFINEYAGTINMAGVGNFKGTPTKIPAYSLTYEEGKRIQRLIERNIPVNVEITTKSFCKDVEPENVVVTFKGKVDGKIVVGAHIDSWDIAPGAIDNGVGSAILFDVARLLKKYNPDNYYTVELVWFNGEEIGLWGSAKYAEMHRNDKIIAMINMDMTGSPTGFNVMGFDEYKPFFENLIQSLNGFNLSDGVVSRPYTNSDHMPFMFEGIPTFTLQDHLDENMYKFYHDRGDSFDKVNKKYLSEAAAVVSIMVTGLSNDMNVYYTKKNEKEMVDLFKKFGLDKRLKRRGEWKYKIE